MQQRYSKEIKPMDFKENFQLSSQNRTFVSV